MRFRTPSPEIERGQLVADVLAGSWRAAPEPPNLPLSELARVAPVLLGTGCGALPWWRTSLGGRADRGAAGLFREAYRLHVVQAGAHEERLGRLLRMLRAAGVEPILKKGWAVARSYPEPGLRPYGDIDLGVRPDQWPAAARVLREDADLAPWVDLHRGVPDLPDRTWDELWGRSVEWKFDGGTVRCLGPEDNLRLLGLHLVRHGAWRPLWLCDVAVTLESLPPRFDWNRCLAGPAWAADWLGCVFGLAARLLGARWDAPVLAARPLPAWLAPAVLRQWGADRPGDSHTRDRRAMRDHLRRPIGLPTALRRRWPNPIEAAARMRAGPFSRWPRVLLQTGTLLERGAWFAVRRRLVFRTEPEAA